MAITDELREWARNNTVQDNVLTTYPVQHPVHGTVESLLAIADRIDAANERLCSHSRSNGYGDGFTDGFNDIESWVIDHEDAMAEHGFARLPKDADGEYIHVGDMLVDGLSQGFAPKKVKMLMLEGNEWMLNFGGGWCAMKNHEWHHHAPDTWERIIEDAREYRLNIGGSYLWTNKSDELVARCKALAGGEQ